MSTHPSTEDLRTWGRRVEDRRAKLGISIDWLCDHAGVFRERYWAKVLAQRGDSFTSGEFQKLAGLMYAPEGWPRDFIPDDARIEALNKARFSGTIQRATEAAARGESVIESLPACPHVREAGPARWCAYCVSELVRTAKERAEEVCARKHSDLELAIEKAEDRGVGLVIAELKSLADQAEKTIRSAKGEAKNSTQAKASVYKKCLAAAWRVRQRDTSLGKSGVHGTMNASQDGLPMASSTTASQDSKES